MGDLWLGLADGKVEVADPARGRRVWHTETLRKLWLGTGFRLVPQ